MRSISLQLAASALAAALILAVFATGADAAAAGFSAPIGNASVGNAQARRAAPRLRPRLRPRRRLQPRRPGTGQGRWASTPPPRAPAATLFSRLHPVRRRRRRRDGALAPKRRSISRSASASVSNASRTRSINTPKRSPSSRRGCRGNCGICRIVVARAARRVRAARSTAEAITALRQAIAVIHKDVALVRAEDPAAQQRETRSGDFVAETLNVASLSLEKAGGL